MIGNLLKPFGSQSFFLGLGVAAAAYFLGPQLMEAVKPMAVKGAQGVMALGSKTSQVFNEGKEKLGNTIEKMTPGERDIKAVDSMYSDLIKELKDEREASNKILMELRDTMVSLRQEISGMKAGADTQPS